MGLIKRLKRVYHSLYHHDPQLDKQFTEQSHHSRIVFFYIDAVMQCTRLGLAMNIDSPLQVAQLIGGVVMSLLSVLLAYFLSSKKFQYYSMIYKIAHVILYMYNMQKLQDQIIDSQVIDVYQMLYFFIFGQLSTLMFLLKLDSLWLEIMASIGQTVAVLILIQFNIFQKLIIIIAFLQLIIFQIINIFKAQKKFLLKLNEKTWLSITDYFYQMPIVITRLDDITQYISLSDCNKTSEIFFEFTGDSKDSEKLNKRIGQFIIDDIGEVAIMDGNISQNIGKSLAKSYYQTPVQNNQANNGTNFNQQKDLKSYLIKKSTKIIQQKNTNKIYSENNQVEVISCTYNNQPYEVQILPVIIDFQLSIALQFHSLSDNQASGIIEKRHTKTLLEKSYFNINIMNNLNGNPSSPYQKRRESVSRNQVNKRINSQSLFNGLGLANIYQGNSSNQNTPLMGSPNGQIINQSNNFQFLNDEREEEVMNIVTFYQMIIKLVNSNIEDLIATLEYGLQVQPKTQQLQIQGLKQLKIEQKLLFDALNLRASYIKTSFQNPNTQNYAQNSYNNVSSQLTGMMPPPNQYHYFDFQEITLAIKHHLYIHGYDYYFAIKSSLPNFYQIYSNKELIQGIIQSCVFMIAEGSKLKSMHYQQQNLMRSQTNQSFSQNQYGQQSQNNPMNAQTNPRSLKGVQTNQNIYKMIIIELTKIVSSNSASNVNVKITNISHPNLLDQQKHSKLSSFFFNVLRLYLDKVGIPASLQYKQNEDNLRYSLQFTLLSDCNTLQIQQQQLAQQYTQVLNSSRQKRIISDFTSCNNAYYLKEKQNFGVEQLIESTNLDQVKDIAEPTTMQKLNLFSNKKDNKVISDQIDINDEDSDRQEVYNEYQDEERKQSKNGRTGIGSEALFIVETPQIIQNQKQLKIDINKINQKAFGPKSNQNIVQK